MNNKITQILYASLLSAVLFQSGLPAGARDTDVFVIKSLDGQWETAISEDLPSTFTSKVPVPGVITMALPALGDNLDELDDDVNYNYVWYKRTFSAPKQKYSHAYLYIRARYNASVWVNGHYIGSDLHCTYSHAVMDLSGAIKYGADNEIVVKVGSWNTATSPSKENEAEWWRTSRAPGIWDSIFISYEGDYAFESIRVIPNLKNKEIIAGASLRHPDCPPCRVEACIIDGDKPLVKKKLRILKGDDIQVILPAEKLKEWTPGKEGNAKMYVIRFRLYSDNGILLAEKSDRFGYRNIEVRENNVFLNGQKIIFRADNIAFVRALTRWSEALFDEHWLRRFIRAAVKEYNINYVRVHLGHASSAFYRIADEEGLMIQDEWRFMHDDEPSGKDLSDTRVEMTRWIEQNYNHPSIVAWDQENEGNVRICDLISDLRKLDPTRLWSEQDFIARHVYDYSERVIDDFEGVSIPGDKPYTVLESCRFWTNEFGELELREDYKTSRCASGWGLYYYDNDDSARLLADLHSDIGTFYRSKRIQAWSPFALLSGSKNGHNYFKGDIIDSLVPQPNLIQLARLNEPVGVSIKMNQAIEWYIDRKLYSPGGVYEINAVLWNDFPERAEASLHFLLKDTEGEVCLSMKKPISVPGYASIEVPIQLSMPVKPGIYFAEPSLILASGSLVRGVSRRFMVSETQPSDAPMAFGGRSVRLPGMDSIFENFLRDSIPSTVEKTLLSMSEGNLIDKLNITDKGDCFIQTTKYTSPQQFITTKITVSPAGEIVTQDESYGKPYGTLSREAQDAISKELDVVPETEARVLVHKMGDNWICELKPEGSRQKVKIKLLSTITP